MLGKGPVNMSTSRISGRWIDGVMIIDMLGLKVRDRIPELKHCVMKSVVAQTLA